jgi:hypothetical protein
VETFNQYLCGRVVLGIEQLMGMTVAAEKTFQSQYITVLGATKDSVVAA